jgi:hypothetical protein
MKHEEFQAFISSVVENLEQVEVAEYFVGKEENSSVSRLTLSFKVDPKEKWEVKIRPSFVYTDGETDWDMVTVQVSDARPVPVPALASLVATMIDHGF